MHAVIAACIAVVSSVVPSPAAPYCLTLNQATLPKLATVTFLSVPVAAIVVSLTSTTATRSLFAGVARDVKPDILMLAPRSHPPVNPRGRSGRADGPQPEVAASPDDCGGGHRRGERRDDRAGRSHDENALYEGVAGRSSIRG